MTSAQLSLHSVNTTLKDDDHHSSNDSDSTETDISESLRLIEDLKYFLATAPVNWQANQIIRRYFLGGDDGFVSCVFWNNLYFITGTDILRCCFYRMEKFGRKIIDRKKFQEGIFSDLRSLKIGEDATLEVARSPFLNFLHKNSCLKTQKKQKVFYWFSVQHDKLFADALERDLKRELLDQKSTTVPVREPALSFEFNEVSSTTLYEQLTKHMEVRDMVSPVQNISHENKYLSEEFDSALTRAVMDDNLNTAPASYKPLTPLGETTNQSGGSRKPTSPGNNDDNDDQEKETNNTNNNNGDDGPGVVSSPLVESPKLYQQVLPEESGQQMFSAYEENVTLGTSKMSVGLDNTVDRTCIMVVNDQDEFPLDYFPVEVEYPARAGQALAPEMKSFANPLFSATSETGGGGDSSDNNNNNNKKMAYSSQSEFDLNKDLQLNVEVAEDMYEQRLSVRDDSDIQKQALGNESSAATLKSSTNDLNNIEKAAENEYYSESVMQQSQQIYRQNPKNNDSMYMDYLLSPDQNQHHFQQHQQHQQQHQHQQQQQQLQQQQHQQQQPQQAQQKRMSQPQQNPYYPEHPMYYPYVGPSGYYPNHPYSSSAPQQPNQYVQYRQPDYYYGYPNARAPAPSQNFQAGHGEFAEQQFSYAPNSMQYGEGGGNNNNNNNSSNSQLAYGQSQHGMMRHAANTSNANQEIVANTLNVPSTQQHGPFTPMFGRMFTGMNGSATMPGFPSYIHNNSPIVTTTPFGISNSVNPSNTYSDQSAKQPPLKLNKVTKKPHDKK